MAYRVGVQCVATQTEADDLVLSIMPPTLTADGQLIRPIRKDDGWYLGQHKIQLTHPECDILQQVQNGSEIGASLIVLASVMFGIKAVMRFVSSLGKVGANED